MSYAQVASSAHASSVPRLVSLTSAALRGTVVDDHSQPLAGVVISALGGTSAFAVSDRSGRFVLHDLPAGPYLVRAHLQGYAPARARIVQVTTSSRDISIALTKVAGKSDQPQVLQAGLAAAQGEETPAADEAGEVVDQSELAWRIRHLPRSVLKDVNNAVIPAEADASFMEGSLSALARAVGSPVRFASFISELPLNGQINLLTSTSFDRPQNLFSMQNGWPASVAFVALTVPTTTGKWDVRGGRTQGDLSSWSVAGSYSWQPIGSSHSYRAGMSYAMQRYLGGNADALAAMADRRNAGEMHAYDRWQLTSRVGVSYGARYERYDYLANETLFSPKASVTVTPLPRGSLRVRGTISRREMAPGAEEFQLPSTGIWTPPGRTFSPASARAGFRPEQINHFEVAAEQPAGNDVVLGVRVFRQRINDQLVTLFGVSLPDTAGTNIGHYYVGNSGDVDARGWGVSVSRSVAGGIHASVDYAQVDAEWLRPSIGSASVALVAPSIARRQFEQLRDLTTSVESELPRLDTRVFVIYKINSGFTRPDALSARPQVGSRFDLEVSQALPFLNFSSAQWEMILAVRNLFHEDVLDASVYDELEVVRPPKHVVGGVTVRF